MRWFCFPILLVFCWIQQAEPLYCYTCTSAERKCCGFQFNRTACKDELAYCNPLRNRGRVFFCSTESFSTTYFENEYDQNDDLYVRKCNTDKNREMSPGNCPNFHVRDVKHGITQVTCQVCKTDGCNGAGRNTNSTLKYLLYAGILFLVIK